MILAYNTNGFAHHRLDDAVAIIAELGYGGVALTPDVNHLSPFDPDRLGQAGLLRNTLQRLGIRSAIETGSRFLLNPRRKHQPTLISPTFAERDWRYEFLHQDCLWLASELNSDCVSFWSGSPTDDASHTVLMDRLVDACKRLADHAAEKKVRLAFEPEPGMFIDTMEKFAELHSKVNHLSFGLTLDLGHLVCNGELPISQHIAKWKDWLWNVHIDDMKPGVHDHLMFGEGEVDFADAFAALKAVNYQGMVSVELSRHSYDAVNAARKSMVFLKSYV